MNKKSLKLILFIFILGVISCDEPETVVTDIVHSDGSVLRKIEMRNKKNVFKPSSLRVPVDSTWIIMDTIEITKKEKKLILSGSNGQKRNLEMLQRLTENIPPTVGAIKLQNEKFCSAGNSNGSILN